ncbi:hypothetical protein SUNI508_05163 [Seiridium unicorne]|uniref:Uncharacterized protein n=1 Tax=Seiridium unicorne TaxID=138068 RepID=A0ABR2V5H5_9PEZI
MSNITMFGWVSDPDGRGTFGIIQSCVITLALCIYTALHLNIPSIDAPQRSKYLTKVKWVIFGMFAPELVVCIAWNQNRQVKALGEDLKKIFKEVEEKNPVDKRKHEWTRVHSFYAVMGGFTVNTSIDGQQFIPDATKRTLSVKLNKFVARLGDLPDFPVEVIKDKSKADALAKSLAIIQAGWFVLQAITRQASGLMVTPLELSTLADAVCALVIYYLWWDKPLDVQSSTDVPTGEQIAAIAAVGWEYRFIKSFNTLPFYFHLPFSFKWETKLKALMILDNDGRLDEEFRCDIRDYAGERIKPGRERPSMAPNILIGNLFQGQPFHGGFLTLTPFFQARDGHISRIFLVSAEVPYSRPNHHELRHPVVRFRYDVELIDPCFRDVQERTPVGLIKRQEVITIRRWGLIFQLDSKYPDTMTSIGARLDCYKVPVISNGALQPMQCEKFVVLQRKNRFGSTEVAEVYRAMGNYTQWASTTEPVTKVMAFIIFFFCTLAYGGVHAAAWNHYFPSSVEQLLWRVAAICMAAL